MEGRNDLIGLLLGTLVLVILIFFLLLLIAKRKDAIAMIIFIRWMDVNMRLLEQSRDVNDLLDLRNRVSEGLENKCNTEDQLNFAKKLICKIESRLKNFV